MRKNKCIIGMKAIMIEEDIYVLLLKQIYGIIADIKISHNTSLFEFEMARMLFEQCVESIIAAIMDYTYRIDPYNIKVYFFHTNDIHDSEKVSSHNIRNPGRFVLKVIFLDIYSESIEVQKGFDHDVIHYIIH